MTFAGNEDYNNYIPNLMPQIHLYLKVMGSPSATPTRLLVDIREELLQTRGQKWNCLSRTRLSNIREQNWKTFFFTMPCSDADPVPPGTGSAMGRLKGQLGWWEKWRPLGSGFPLCQPLRSGKAMQGGSVPPECHSTPQWVMRERNSCILLGMAHGSHWGKNWWIKRKANMR